MKLPIKHHYFEIHVLNPDNSVIIEKYSARKWEVSCILISAVTGHMAIELKNYDSVGNQILKKLWAKHFEIIYE